MGKDIEGIAFKKKKNVAKVKKSSKGVKGEVFALKNVVGKLMK